MNKYPNEIEPFAIETEASVARWNKLQRVLRERDELVAALQSMIVAHRKLAGAAETEVVDRAIAALAKVQS